MSTDNDLFSVYPPSDLSAICRYSDLFGCIHRVSIFQVSTVYLQFVDVLTYSNLSSECPSLSVSSEWHACNVLTFRPSRTFFPRITAQVVDRVNCLQSVDVLSSRTCLPNVHLSAYRPSDFLARYRRFDLDELVYRVSLFQFVNRLTSLQRVGVLCISRQITHRLLSRQTQRWTQDGQVRIFQNVNRLVWFCSPKQILKFGSHYLQDVIELSPYKT